VTNRCLELGINVIKFGGLGSVLRIAPPLTVAAEEIDLGLEILWTARSATPAMAGPSPAACICSP
jgi:2,2-dialkylglycine decarboxylase (pyruvate)